MHVKPASDTYLTLCYRVVYATNLFEIFQNQIILFALILKSHNIYL
jgi:hypothetical protein